MADLHQRVKELLEPNDISKELLYVENLQYLEQTMAEANRRLTAQYTEVSIFPHWVSQPLIYNVKAYNTFYLEDARYASERMLIAIHKSIGYDRRPYRMYIQCKALLLCAALNNGGQGMDFLAQVDEPLSHLESLQVFPEAINELQYLRNELRDWLSPRRIERR